MELRLGDSEYRFAQLVWRHEPVASGRLVKLAAAELGWKKSTTYTVLKNLCNKGVLQNENALVTALVKESEVQKQESASVVDRAFGGSLPGFVAAFLNQKGISPQEADQIQAMIDQYREGQK
ncbi:BlaI/MecI/CopY family transcriptional regulator [Allofournierella sp.]|uniref:BlaI/MecI/CopY family transcriptional regulator n=1 Tax=Allofournierella sp. TaxID=1940256 RepID=UPI003AB6C73D